MGLFAFIQVPDPTKVKVGERECAEEEAKLLYFTIGRVDLLLPVAPARSENELEASVERLFDEGCSADQVDSAVDVGQEVETGIATGVRIIAEENVVVERPKRPRKKRQAATDASSSSHPPKKLKGTTELPVRQLFMVNLLSATPEHESGAPANSIIGFNIRTIGASKRFVISLDSSRHSSTHASEAKGDSIIKSDVVPLVITEVVVISHAVDIPLVLNMVVKSNMGTACQACLNAKVRMLTKYCLNERKRLESEYEKQVGLLKVRDAKIKSLKAQLLLKETETAEDVHLRAQVCVFEAVERMHDLELKELNVVVSSLRFQKDGLVGQVHELEATFFGLRGQGLQLAVTKCLNSQEYLSALGAAISCAIEKGMHDRLSADIDHGKAGRNLEDVAAYNPSAEANYTSVLQSLREVGFPLLAELKSHKDASTTNVMDLLRLEGPLVDAPRMSDLQPNIEQLKLPIHCPEDQVILGETYLLEALDVTHSHIKKIRENVAAQRSALIGVWTPLVDPLFVENLVGATDTSNSMPVTAATTTSLSVTFASAVSFLLSQ
uniref:Transposase (Putative), gypsy type n=1 Tax=Tanacetum cinerariifolium TaxID=118510 RepID=A0A699HTY6_TANCI|nr:hypothetical protein [Tanacetum cinerariifolium]